MVRAGVVSRSFRVAAPGALGWSLGPGAFVLVPWRASSASSGLDSSWPVSPNVLERDANEKRRAVVQ
jgi:hypothetical protein